MKRNSSGAEALIGVRVYGAQGPEVFVLHGGPGAAGYMAPVCRELSESFRVFEPLQRMSEGEPLSVGRHVTDLHDVISLHRGVTGPAVIGHSWGAMLALAFAAEYPEAVRCLILIGCGTFDPASRVSLETSVQRRLTPAARLRVQRLPTTVADPDVRLCVMGRLLEAAYSCDLLPHGDETEYYDARGHAETWKDMLRLQRTGVYPGAFSRITVPVLMLHGTEDPHPGRSTHAILHAVLPQVEYVELSNCGHYPWLERHAREPFYALIEEWLLQNTE